MEEFDAQNVIKLIRNGGKDAFVSIVEHFEPRIRAFVVPRCYDRHSSRTKFIQLT